MKRYRWFAVANNFPMEEFVKNLRHAPISNERNFGFTLLDTIGNNRFALRHLRQSSIQITTLDTEGNATRQNISTISEIDFEVFEQAGRTWLRIDDPPRSLRDFMNNLEDISGFGFSINPVVLALESQRNALKNLDSIKLVGFKGIGNSSHLKMVMRIDVASQEGLAPNRLNFLQGLEFRMDQTTFEVTYQMARGQITFGSSGVVRATGALTPYLIACVEKELHQVNL